MDERYFYYRDAAHRPLVTLARLTTEAGVLAYGWAICSPLDAPRKRTGRSIAKQRALAALAPAAQRYGTPEVVIWPREIVRDEALDTLTECGAHALLVMAWEGTVTTLPPSMRPATGEAPDAAS